MGSVSSVLAVSLEGPTGSNEPKPKKSSAIDGVAASRSYLILVMSISMSSIVRSSDLT